MSDETETEEAPPQDPPSGDELADQGLDDPGVAGAPVVDEAPEPYEPPAPQPEPTLVGHLVIQDNVSEPGFEHTHTVVDGEHHESVRKTVLDPEPEDDEEPVEASA